MIRKELFEMTQEELIVYIERELNERGVPYNRDENGNIWSIRFKGKPVFVSHMDTVSKSDEEYRKKAFIVDNILFKVDAVLGGDDRAGVNLIVNHLENINFVLTTDEEIGCIGASALSRNEDFKADIENICAFIEIDRKGNSDVIGALHGYCEKDFVDEILKVLPKHNDARGVLTDIDKFIHLKPGVNISAGYYNAHSVDEYLDIEYFNYLDSKILELANIAGDFSLPKPRRTYTSGKYTKSYLYPYSNYFDDDVFVRCSECGRMVSDLECTIINGKIICDECFKDLSGIQIAYQEMKSKK